MPYVSETSDSQFSRLYQEFAKKLVATDEQLLSALDQKLVQALALQRLQHLLSSDDPVGNGPAVEWKERLLM